MPLRILVELGHGPPDNLDQLAALPGLGQLVPQFEAMINGTMSRSFMRPRIFRVRAISRLGQRKILHGIRDFLDITDPTVEIVATLESQKGGDPIEVYFAVEKGLEEADEASVDFRRGKA